MKNDLPTAVCSNWGFGLNLKLVLCLEDWFLIYSFGLSNPQLQQATGVVRQRVKGVWSGKIHWNVG